MTTENKTTHGDMVLTRVFDAPRPVVFKAWTDPAQLAQWWGPHGFTNPRCEWDARPGGLIRVDMRGPDGTVYPMPGEFREVVEPERLVFTSGALNSDGALIFEILNTVTFAETDGKTTITLHTRVLRMTGEAEQHLAGQEIGWSQSLERLGSLIIQPKDAGGEGEREIVISRVFDAPRELVWDAMTNPLHVVNWWGPRGFTTTIEEMDVRPGGVWKHVMHGPDGTDFPNHSVFTEVAKPERISYSNGGGREGDRRVGFEATWTFETEEAGKTKTTIRMVFPSAAERERVVRDYGAIEGGKQTLERLAERLAAAPLIVERTLDAPLEMVWKAITDREQIKQWFFDMEDFRPEVGCEFRFVVEHDGNTFDHRCVIREVTPRSKFSYTWRYEGYEGDSLVTFELFPEGSKTRIRVTHTGLDSFPASTLFARENFMQGWTSLIGTQLPKFLRGSSTRAQ
jgi:uncharacterized protein YndB with AHSA1/START domain